MGGLSTRWRTHNIGLYLLSCSDLIFKNCSLDNGVFILISSGVKSRGQV